MQIQLKDGKATWKQEWKVVGGKRIFFRSRWELRYALYLQLLKEKGDIKQWEHEPKVFHFMGVKNGSVSYKPDFEVIHKNGSIEFIEVKGYETGKDRSKWKRMAKFHPEVKLRIVRKDFFSANNKALKCLIKEWE